MMRLALTLATVMLIAAPARAAEQKTFVQYDLATGDIAGTTTGKVVVAEDGRKERVGPDPADLPAGRAQIAFDGAVDTSNKRVNLKTMQLEDVPRTAWDAFREEWPHEKIVEALDDPVKFQQLNEAVRDEEIQARKDEILDAQSGDGR